MNDRYKKINIYDMYPNSGELELGANLLDPTASANFTNRTNLGNSYFDAIHNVMSIKNLQMQMLATFLVA